MAATLEHALVPSASGGDSAQLTALLEGAGVSRADQSGWIRVTGQDCVRWLNGMVTNSIQGLAPGEGCYNFVLNAQGRIQGDLTAFAEPDALLLKTDRQRLPGLMALLDRFIIMDDVELADVSAELAGISVTGPKAAGLLEQAGLPVSALSPMHRQASSWRNFPVTILQEYSPLVPRFEVWSTPETADAIYDVLVASGATVCDTEAMEQLRIREGTPRYGTDIHDRDLPQETGQTRALHFSKGCYLGQEIVERIRSRGNVHRTFQGFALTGALPAAGTALVAEGKPVGELTSVAAIPLKSGTIQLALGYVRREALDRGLALAYPGGSAAPVALPWTHE